MFGNILPFAVIVMIVESYLLYAIHFAVAPAVATDQIHRVHMVALEEQGYTLLQSVVLSIPQGINFGMAMMSMADR